MPDPASPARSSTAGPLPAKGAAPPGRHRGRSFLAHRRCPAEGERAACGREARAWHSRTAEPATSDCKYHSSAVPWGHAAEGSGESRAFSAAPRAETRDQSMRRGRDAAQELSEAAPRGDGAHSERGDQRRERLPARVGRSEGAGPGSSSLALRDSKGSDGLSSC